MSKMSILGEKGDVLVEWDVDSDPTVQEAERIFNEYVKEMKYAAFDVGPDGQGEKKLKDFDPLAFEIVLVRSIAGG